MTCPSYTACSLREHLGSIQPTQFMPEISYTIEEVVADDCYHILEHADSCSHFLDIGANLGIVSLAYRKHNAGARIVALEPHPYTARFLVENTQRASVEVCLHGLGNGKTFPMPAETSDGWTPFRAAAKDGAVSSYTAFGMPLHRILDHYRIGRPHGGMSSNNRHHVAIKIDCEGGESALLDDEKSTRALYDLLFTNGGCVGIEIHLGDKYPSYRADGSPATAEAWSKWATDNFPAAWGRRIHDHNPTAKILTFQNFKVR